MTIPLHRQLAAVRDEIREMQDSLCLPLRGGVDLVIERRDLWLFTYDHWSLRRHRNTHYLQRKQGGKTLHFHREVIAAPEGVLVDHANGNGLDNRRSNLRDATRVQNNWNRAAQRDKSTGFMGVSLHPHSGMYRARMRLTSGRELCSYHSEAVEAARARDAMAAEARGAFACLNFPDPAFDHIACMQAVLDTLTKLQAAEKEAREPSLFPPT